MGNRYFPVKKGIQSIKIRSPGRASVCHPGCTPVAECISFGDYAWAVAKIKNKKVQELVVPGSLNLPQKCNGRISRARERHVSKTGLQLLAAQQHNRSHTQRCGLPLTSLQVVVHAKGFTGIFDPSTFKVCRAGTKKGPSGF